MLLPATMATAQSQPNIILINMDDADAELFELPYSTTLFPNIMELAGDGVSFSNFHVTTPLCGPSRASLYRGQYAHNTGICSNRPGDAIANGFNGGFRYYREQGYFQDDLSIWLKNAGYRTMMVGKFLHGDVERWVPPGWDDFRHYFGGRYYETRVFTNERIPAGEVEVLPPGKYRTVAETEDALEILEAHVARRNGQPFFLNINPLGPHQAQQSAPEMIEQRKENWWKAMQLPFSRAYNEADMSDKGQLISSLAPLDAFFDESNRFHFRERALATHSIDDMVASIRQRLRDLNLEQNTYIFLTSDNGFLLGHHRIRGKCFPFDRSSRVPCFVVGPGVPAGVTGNQLIGHIDLAPTFMQLAGGSTPDFVDGRSFAGLLYGDALQRYPSFRKGLLIENWSSMNMFGQSDIRSVHCSVRFEDAVYTEWANGDREYYDLATDPDQLDNQYDQLPIGRQQWCAYWLRTLVNPNIPIEARFSEPFFNQQPIVTQAALSGVAQSWGAVDQVRVALRDAQTGQYWNGQQWQAAFTQLEASLDQRDGQLTNWTLDEMPPKSTGTSGEFAAWAWAYDSQGNYGTPFSLRFHYDHQGPELSFDEDNPTVFEGPVTVFGTAVDDIKATRVSALVRNATTNRYWNGNDFQQAPVEIVLSVGFYDNFNWVESLPIGRYDFTAVATDASGNRSNSAVFQFEVR